MLPSDQSYLLNGALRVLHKLEMIVLEFHRAIGIVVGQNGQGKDRIPSKLATIAGGYQNNLNVLKIKTT